MAAVKELIIVETDKLVFANVVSFSKEISNPMIMKKEMDQLIERLGKYKIKHCHKVITKVVDRNENKKTIVLKIMVPVADRNGLEDFLDQYKQYIFSESYNMNSSVRISIPNDMNEFKRAVEKFVEYSNLSNVNDLNLKENHIIEVAKVDLKGNVIGFDLHMEKSLRGEEANAFN